MQESDPERLLAYLGAPGGQLAYGSPPFAFDLEAPPDFHVFHTEPARLRVDVETACRSTPGWRNLDGATQTSVRRMMTDTVHQSVRAGVLLTTMATGARVDGTGVSVVTLTLSWMRVRPFEADLDLAHLAAGPEEDSRELEGAVATMVSTSGWTDSGPDGQSLPDGARWRHDVQVFVPVTGTEWMAVVSGSTAEPERAEAVRQAVERMAASLRPDAAQLDQLRASAPVTARTDFDDALHALTEEER